MLTKERPRIRTFWTKEEAEQVAEFRRKSCNELTEIRPSSYGGKPAFKLISYPAQ